MQREKGWRAPKSGRGYPHGKDKKKARAERVEARKKANLKTYRVEDVRIFIGDKEIPLN